jgi:hypothetical protein
MNGVLSASGGFIHLWRIYPLLSHDLYFLKSENTAYSIMIQSVTKEDQMELKKYFEDAEGNGVLATADSDGKVDAAIYARPHFMNDGTIALIMRNRLTHHNLQSNPHACYMFIEKGAGYKGKRFFLTKVREEQDSELLQSLRRRQYIEDRDESSFLVFFKIDRELPLVGAGN